MSVRTLLGLIAILIGGHGFVVRAASLASPTVILVVGAAGEPEYGTNFQQQAALWIQTAEKGGVEVASIGLNSESGTNDLEQLKSRIQSEPLEGVGELWLVLIGHGTFDGKDARFNLRGPDVSAADLADWLKPIRRPLAIINTASSSAPFLKALSGTNRVVVTATRSGAEQNVTRFGLPLAAAFQDPEADLDHDGQTSLLEAFLAGSRGAAEFYKTSNRLATEHALLEDNGDGLGTPADWFRGVRATKRARDGASLDGALAQRFVLIRSSAEQALDPEMRVRRDEMERVFEEIRSRKANMKSEEYYRALEALLLDLARLYESVPTSR